MSFNVLRLASSSKPNIVSLVRSSRGYQERSSPIFVDSIFPSFAFLRSSGIDADRFVARFYEIERNARPHLSPRYHRRVRHRCGWKGICSSIDTRREEGCDRNVERTYFLQSFEFVRGAPCTVHARVASGMLRARRKKRIFHASGTPIYARPFLDALKRLKLSIEWTSGSAVLTSLPVSSHRYEWEIVIDTGGRTIYRGKRRSLEKKVRTIIEKDGGR